VLERDRTLTDKEKGKLALLLRLLRLRELLARLADLCLSGVLDPDIADNDRERVLLEEGGGCELGWRSIHVILRRALAATIKPVTLMTSAPETSCGTLLLVLSS